MLVKDKQQQKQKIEKPVLCSTDKVFLKQSENSSNSAGVGTLEMLFKPCSKDGISGSGLLTPDAELSISN